MTAHAGMQSAPGTWWGVLCVLLGLLCMPRVAMAADLLTPEERGWLTANQSRLVLAVETGYPPFAFLDPEGRPAGLAHEFLTRVEEKLGVRFPQRQFGSLEEIFAKVRGGEVHLVNAVTQTPSRSQFLAFTAPFVTVPNVIIVRKDRAGQLKEGDLAGLSVSLVQNYAVTEYLTQRGLVLAPALVPDDATALLDVSFGRSVAAVVDLATASHLISTKGITNLRVAGDTLFPIRLSLAVPLAQPMLRDILQKGLGSITEAERAELWSHWVEPLRANPLASPRLWGVLTLLVVVATGTLAWNWTLRRQVALHTADLAREKESLRASELRYRSLFQANADGIVILDPESATVIDCNDQACRQLGYTREEFLKLCLADIDLVETPDQTRAHVRGVMAKGHGEFETLQRTKQGEPRNVHVKAQYTKIGGRGVYHCIWRDITEYRAAQRALEESEERYRKLFENMADVVYRTDKAGRVEMISPSCLRTLGYSQAEMLGRNLREFYARPEERDAFVDELLVHGQTANFQVEIRCKDGSFRWGSTNARALYDQAGAFCGVEGVTRDITALKAAEEERTRLEDQLRQTQKLEALGTLAGGIAHDFNNILSAILGFSELLKTRMRPGSEDEEDLNEVLQAARRARELVKQILTFSRKARESVRPVQVHLVVGEALRLLRQTIPTTIEIRQNIAKEQDTVLADATQLHQVVMNLGTNAYHAMRREGGRLEVTLEPVVADAGLCSRVPDLSEGPYVRLSVEDTGEGMPPETLTKIFEPFFTTKPQGEGTGMGMAVVHGIVRGCGGAITVVSEPGRGTRVDVYLPRQREPAEDQVMRSAALPSGSGRILVVDDEPALAKMTAKMLSSLGYSADYTSSSGEALERFRKNPQGYDLVLTDQTMPEMSGAALAVELMRLRPDLPVALCTGYSEAMNEERAAAIGVRALLAKPLETALLARVVRGILGEG